MQAYSAVAAMVLALAALAASAASAASEDRYLLPLVGPYAIVREGANAGATPPTTRPHRLVIAEKGTGSAYSFDEIVPGVERYAVSGTRIVGTSAEGHFIVQTDGPRAEPTFYSSREAWEAALAEASAAADVELLDPDAVAATLPDRTKRPWDYRMMGGALGWSDDAWSLAAQLAGLAAAFLYGLLRKPHGGLAFGAAFIGVATNVVANIVIAGGGGGAFVGFLALPLLCILAAHLGRLTGEIIRALAARGTPPPDSANPAGN